MPFYVVLKADGYGHGARYLAKVYEEMGAYGIAVSCYAGLFNPLNSQPLATYYGFHSFGEMYKKLKNQVKCEVEGENLYAVAATDGVRQAVLISNPKKGAQEIETNLPDGWNVYLIDKEHHLTKEEISSSKFTLGAEQVIYIKNF